MSNNSIEAFENFAVALSKFSIGYNKAQVLSSITGNTMEIISRNITGMREDLETVVSAFEEIRATSESATNNSDSIGEMMEEVLAKNSVMDMKIDTQVHEIEQAASDAQEINTLFLDFSKEAEKIQNITGNIQDVSDRTNILAINASIEAARAGEVGKGFQIIASEVRKLANQTGDFAKEIETAIHMFTSSIKTMTEKMDNFLEILERFQDAFGDIRATFKEHSVSVNDTGNHLTQISGAIREQNEAITEGLKSLEGVFSSTRDNESVLSSLSKSYTSLDDLLDRKS